MFELITTRASTLGAAYEFVAANAPDLQITNGLVLSLLPENASFPCLVEWFTSVDHRGHQMLGCNVCTKSDAKCLIYPSTNKSTKYSQIILQSDIDIQLSIRKSSFVPNGWRDVAIDTIPEFDDILRARKTPYEPFFIKIRVLYKNPRLTKSLRISIINLEMAKELVYYSKNTSIKHWGSEKLFEINEISEVDEVAETTQQRLRTTKEILKTITISDERLIRLLKKHTDIAV